MIDRDIAYRNWKHSNLDTDHSLYKTLRNRVNLLIKNAKSNHLKQRINVSAPSKQLWRNIKNLGITKSNSSSTVCDSSANDINQFFYV